MRRIIARIKAESVYYGLLLKHPKTPRLSRILLGCALAYLVSPIDLIPDVIPVFGQLDDLLIVPSLVGLSLAGIPKAVKIECREQAFPSAVGVPGRATRPAG